MTAAALSGWWVFGWAVALVVVLLAASLLVIAVVLARRIGDQATEIEEALDGARQNTDPLWEVKTTNLTIARINHGLATARKALGG